MLLVEFTLRVDVCVVPDDSMTLGGLNDIASPVGEEVADRLTVPLKPFWLVSVIVEVVDEP